MFSLYKIWPSVIQTSLTPYLPCASFNKPTSVAVKLSLIKKLSPLNFYLFLYIVLHTSWRANLIIMGLCLPLLQTFGLPTWCDRSRSSSRISICISCLTVFIIISFVFSPSNSRKPCNKNNLCKNTVLILHYPPILTVTIQRFSQVRNFLSFFSQYFSNSSNFADGNC